ncbi:ABC transporter ATP-binding protein [Mucilaginibacter sp. KACC 22063]|uniref:ABC transporter ATP-binding protein n=1 Tax=Mucilaginibacter sp. KACC 22063 TaxID=3025666 RepID=UPI0023668D0B|nr:ABC transporter ATP-binding protein [Mucilaginibacter sp. KACC 22063]WDF57284.1 ABC transporter ATP-binding protein [Mucilaginibacter sp. KACC 22063]
MNTLSIKNLSKIYPNGVKALDGLSLEIGNGMFGLLGPNGAGKSSLMKTLAGLQQADEGEVYFNDTNVLKDPSALKKQLGFLPQDFGVYPKVSAYDLLTHIAVLKGLTNAVSRKEQVLALLAQTNLYEQRNKEVHTFSGGMRQRFGVAQALLGDPKLVIVDEPTSGLDPEERNRLNNLLSEIGEERIVILSTHLVEDVKNLCPRMAVMHKGRIIAQGEPAELIKGLEGKVWQKTINKADKAVYEQQFRLISSQLIMGRLRIHVYDDKEPNNGFERVNPVLEDVYFHLLTAKN